MDCNYTVKTINGKVTFRGRYRKDLETPNWHYYKTVDGVLIHFRKEHIVYIKEGH